jgi:hypothetical protein
MDDSLWPWLTLAGAGALHGLNPASGWALAAVWSARRGARGTAWRALGPLAVGHVAAIGLLVVTVRQGMPVDGGAVRAWAWVLVAVAAALHCSHRVPLRLRAAAGPVGLALGAFVMAGLHGAGSSFVPALMPLCAGTQTAVAHALGFALAGVGVHVAAMLLVTAAMAGGGARLMQAWRARLRRSDASIPDS